MCEVKLNNSCGQWSVSPACFMKGQVSTMLAQLEKPQAQFLQLFNQLVLGLLIVIGLLIYYKVKQKGWIVACCFFFVLFFFLVVFGPGDGTEINNVNTSNIGLMTVYNYNILLNVDLINGCPFCVELCNYFA